MRKNDLMKSNDIIIRVLEIKGKSVLIIDCLKRTMPKWVDSPTLENFTICGRKDLLSVSGIELIEYEKLNAKERQIAHEHFTLVAGILPFIADTKKRNFHISALSKETSISKQTIRHYLCLYLIYQDISALVPKRKIVETSLSADEKNMRWALNKYFYTKNKNSLNDTYIFLLKEKYSDVSGQLLPKFPTFNQFRYFYRKHKKLQTYYISRDGIKSYQRNNRPLTGDGIQNYAPYVGICMLDSTICDIYLINKSGGLIGRPILTAAVDGYSSLCVGYSLQWEGGIYSVKNLMKNILANKVQWCLKKGIRINPTSWSADKLPAVFVTDCGSEFRSETFEQISELGVKVVNLPAYRPELKGSVEKFFDLVQESYKPYLRGKGVIDPDFLERGAHDYRKDACLTMVDFERVIIYCIVYYNSQRIIENFPYTEEMINAKIEPYANKIYAWGCLQSSSNLLDIDFETVMLVLLPRTTGRFTRRGLVVNKMRYHAEGFTEYYLRGDTAIVAYNPDDVSFVWLLQEGHYTKFSLIESRYKGNNLETVFSLLDAQKAIINEGKTNNLQAKIELAEHIQAIARSTSNNHTVNIKSVRENRKREKNKTHIDFLGGENNNE